MVPIVAWIFLFSSNSTHMSENLKNWIWFINKNGRNFLSRGIKYHLMSDLVNNNCHKSTEEHNQNPSGMWLSRYIIIKLIRPSFYHQTQLLWLLVLLFGRVGRTLKIFGHPIGKFFLSLDATVVAFGSIIWQRG